MSISALSSNSVDDLSQQQRQNPFQQIRQDFNQLASALQSGDLSGAQSAYSNIQQLLQGQQSSSTSSSVSGSTPASTIQNDFATLGQALQSGDLTQAQGAFSQLQNDIQTATQASGSQAQNLRTLVAGHHHHHHHGGGSKTQNSTSTDSSSTDSTAPGINLYA